MISANTHEARRQERTGSIKTEIHQSKYNRTNSAMSIAIGNTVCRAQF